MFDEKLHWAGVENSPCLANSSAQKIRPNSPLSSRCHSIESSSTPLIGVDLNCMSLEFRFRLESRAICAIASDLRLREIPSVRTGKRLFVPRHSLRNGPFNCPGRLQQKLTVRATAVEREIMRFREIGTRVDGDPGAILPGSCEHVC